MDDVGCVEIALAAASDLFRRNRSDRLKLLLAVLTHMDILHVLSSIIFITSVIDKFRHLINTRVLFFFGV